MGSTFILKVRTCLKTPQLPCSAHLFCTREFKQHLGGRPMDRGNSNKSGGQGGLRIKNIIQGTDDGFSKKSTVRKLPSFPKSVFAAGTAKRTAEILRRKTSLVSEDEEEPAPRTSKRGGTEVCVEVHLYSLEFPELKHLFYRKSAAARSAALPRWVEGPEGVSGESKGFWQPDDDCDVQLWVRTGRRKVREARVFDACLVDLLCFQSVELYSVLVSFCHRSLLSFVAVETGTLSYMLLLRYLYLCVSGGHDGEVFDVYNIMRGSFPSLETGASSLFIKSFSRTERWKEAIDILQEVKKVKICAE